MTEEADRQLFKEAYNRTLGLISRREHSAAELRRKLASRDYPESIREQVLAQLQDRELQDDERFAEVYIESKKRRGFGPMKISAELGKHGIDRQVLRALLGGDDQWLDECRSVMTRKFGTTEAMDQRENLRRSRFLQQRGFNPAMVAKILRDSD